MSLEQIEWVLVLFVFASLVWLVVMGLLTNGFDIPEGEHRIVQYVFIGLPFAIFGLALLGLAGINAWEWIVANYPQQ